MRTRGRWTVLLMAVVGLAGGVALGLWYGWQVDPVEYTDTDIAHLHPAYKDDFVLMVAEAYALDGDLGIARARLAMLGLADPAAAVADRAERAIAQEMPSGYVRALVRLAVAMGARRDSFQPFLTPADGSR